MTRRRKGASLTGAETEPRLRSFEALASLRGKKARAARGLPDRRAAMPADIGGSSEQPGLPTETDARNADDDSALFKAAVADARPLKDTGRALIEGTKPAPLPRRPTADDAIDTPHREAPRRKSSSDEDLFREAVGDVIPLRQDERADVGRRPAPVARHAPDAAKVHDRHGKYESPPLPASLDGLSDAALFSHAMRGTIPVGHRDRVELDRPPPQPRPVKRSEDEQAALREAMESPISLEDRLEGGDEAAFLRGGIPRRVLTDLRRGRWVLQGELDLHGLKRDEAREALADFLTTCLQQGRRCVRVIHGKGLGSPGRQSILKHLSHGWLAQREEILAFCQAAPAQGGSGALMVLLRGRKAARD